jgi:hypothetical protein
VERQQGWLELLTAARHKTRPRNHFDWDIDGNGFTRLEVQSGAIALTHAHLRGHQESRGLVAVIGQATLDKQVVEPDALQADNLQAV